VTLRLSVASAASASVRSSSIFRTSSGCGSVPVTGRLAAVCLEEAREWRRGTGPQPTPTTQEPRCILHAKHPRIALARLYLYMPE
jgi:hypothetical protein